MAMQVLNQKAI